MIYHHILFKTRVHYETCIYKHHWIEYKLTLIGFKIDNDEVVKIYTRIISRLAWCAILSHAWYYITICQAEWLQKRLIHIFISNKITSVSMKMYTHINRISRIIEFFSLKNLTARIHDARWWHDVYLCCLLFPFIPLPFYFWKAVLD